MSPSPDLLVGSEKFPLPANLWLSRLQRLVAPAWSAVLLAVLIAAWSAPAAHAQASTTADVVYGQLGSFTTNTVNSGGESLNSLHDPDGLAVDSSGNLYVSDQQNGRVLFYPSGSTTATRVYGQGSGVTANSLNGPYGIALDSSGGLYVADYGNNRVLFFPSGSTTASRVYGQGGDFTANTANNGGISANSLKLPTAVALDATGNLYVADQYNSRVLFYPSGSTIATQVYGQGGSFTSGNANHGGTSANSLAYPTGVALDSSGNLYVGDGNNSRVLFYPHGSPAGTPASATATQVYGQGGNFTTNTANNGGVSATSLENPAQLVLDSSGNLYVADAYNNRVLFYPAGITTAARVYGQGGSFTTSTANTGGVSANSLDQPWAITLDSSGNLYVADLLNQRVLQYGRFGNVNVCPTGQTTPAPCNRTATLPFNIPAGTTIGSVKILTTGIPGLDFQAEASDPSTTLCTAQYYASATTCTVDVTFAPLAPGVRMGAVQLFDNSTPANLLAITPISGIGQGPAIAFAPGVQSALIGTGGLNNPTGVAVDAVGDVFVVDSHNNQIVELPAGGAPRTTVPTTGLIQPWGVAVDGAGDLFIGDSSNNRVVKITPSGVQTTVPTTGLSEPLGVAVDGAGDLFIADDYNNRVVEIPAGCTVAACQTTIASGLNNPNGMAVDGAGDVFIVDSSSQLTEIPAGCTTAACQTTVGSGFSNPRGVAVDAAGDIFVGDTYNGQVVEIPAGCTSATCQTTVGSGFGYPRGVAVDGAGDLFTADFNDGQLDEVNRSQAPSLSFATTYAGSTSSDSPQSFTIQNIGNQPLDAVAPGLVVSDTLDFLQVPGTGTPPDCTSSFALAPGADCNVSISFTPLNLGSLIADVDFSDNALNAIPSAPSVSQSVQISGQSLAVGPTLTVSGSGSGTISATPSGINCTLVDGIGSGSCSGGVPIGPAITVTEVPSAGYVFTGWGGACAVEATSQVCSVKLKKSSTVTASFVPGYTMQLTEVGNGTGTVADDQSQISCSETSGAVAGTCSGSYPSGTTVTLTAAASGGTIFAGWGGDCASFGAGTSCTLTVNSALNPTASFVAQGSSQSGALKPITAGVVYGQSSFTSAVGSVFTFVDPDGLAVDNNGNFYVADTDNNRVLFYPAGSTAATRVYGQGGSFTNNTADDGGISANSLARPIGVATDSSGNLYVADSNNNRVLFYPAGSTTATRVYGQGGSFTTNVSDNGGVSAHSLAGPGAVAVDSSGNLYVADSQNNRVLFYTSGSTTATQVYGQGGSFTSNAGNNGGISANSLGFPTALTLDSSGNLYVADNSNNRVLFYPYNSTRATRVYGQGGSFTSNAASIGGFNEPWAVATDSGGNLYVSDLVNNRVLFYPVGSTTATRVYGQGGSFTSATANNGGISANSIRLPLGLVVDSSGNLYVADQGNNRVLEYGTFGNVNVCPSGVTTPAPCNKTISLSYYAAAQTSFGATQVVTQGVSGLDFSLASGGTCTGTVAAGSSCLVNVNLAPLAPGLRMGAVQLFDTSANPLTTAPVYGIGQAPVITFGPGTQSVFPTSGLNRPASLALDAAGDVFIADSSNNQIVKVTLGGFQTTVPTSGLNGARGVAVDGTGNLFILDNGNSRLVEIPAGCATSACQVTVPTTGLNTAGGGLAVDGAGDIFIADSGNGRVVKVTPSGVQTKVPASGLSGPFGVAVDAAGDVFIADTYGNQVVEVTPGGVQTTVPTLGVTSPEGVWVDAAGDVFVADSIPNNRVVEVPAGGGAQTTVYTGEAPEGVATDGGGDIFIADTFNGRVELVSLSQQPSFNFALTNVGSTSSDSPQAISVQNVGNQPLAGSVISSLGANFLESGSCNGGFSLAPGVTCTLNFSFTPQSTGYSTGSASLSDNTFNLSPLVVLQTINVSGLGGLNGQAVTVAVPNVVGLAQAAAATTVTGVGLAAGNVSTASSSVVPAGSVIASNPAAGTQVNFGTAVALLVSNGQAPPPQPNPLTFENNYFVTGDYAAAGVTLRGTGHAGMATGTITIPSSTANPGISQGVPDGADILEAYLYWETLENTPTASATNGTFLGYAITGQQIGSDLPYTDGAFSGTLRAYRADVNIYLPVTNGIRYGSGAFKVSLPDGGSALPLTEGASLVVIYRVISSDFPLKSVVIYDGSAIPTATGSQNVQGFYDAVGGASGTGENTTLSYSGGSWNNSFSSVTLGQSSQYNAPLNPGSAYAAVILSTPVNNSDNDGILDAWKAGPAGGDFYSGQPGYYDVKTGAWVSLPGAKHGEKDLFVQLDYMCGAVLSDGSCDPNQENLFPAPDALGNDPLAMVKSAFAAGGVTLHLNVGNAVPETTCTDNLTTNPPQLCQFPSQPGVISWKNSLELSKLWPRNFASCAAGGDCTTRFQYGQKDSYHYVLVGHSLAIPAWNSPYGSLVSIQVVNGVTTIVTADRGAGINACPSRFTISGVLGNPALNGIYNTVSCADTKTITLATPGVPNWSYPNSGLPEPVIGLTSGTVTSISGYSDLGGSDTAVTLGLWETAMSQDMSKRANVTAGTLFHEIGHTLGLSHGGTYHDTAGSYIPTYDPNCKPNYQSVMNYLFQLDLVGPNAAVAYSNQSLTNINESTAGSVTQLTDPMGNPATFATSAWYVPYTSGATTASPATLHCDGTPLSGTSAYRVNGPIAPITPAWSNGQDINFDGQLNPVMRGYNDWAGIDLRQVGATGGEFASEASVVSFGSSSAPVNVAAGGSVTLGSGGTVALGSGGTVTLGSGGNVTLGSGGTIALGSAGTVTLASGGTVTLGSAATLTPGRNGLVTLGSVGGTVTLGSEGTITLGSGGNVVLGSEFAGGNVTLGSSGGTVTLGSSTVTVGAGGGIVYIPAGGGTITLGSGGNVVLGSSFAGNVTLGGAGTITLGSGGVVVLGSAFGGNVTLGSGGTIALGSAGGTIALGSGGNVTLGSSGGTVTLGSGGTVTLGSGGNVTLGSSGGTVTLGSSAGDLSLGSGGNVTLGSGGTVTLGSGGTVTLGSGGTVALGSAGGNVTLGSGGTITMGSGGTVALGSAGGNVTLGSGGTITLGSAGGTVTLGSSFAGQQITLGSGGTVTLGSGVVQTYGAGGVATIPAGGGLVTLGSGGNVILGSVGGNVTLGGAGTITLGSSGGTVTLGSAGGTVTLGGAGTITLGSGGNITLGSGGTVTLGSSGGNVTLGSSGGVVTLGSGGLVTLGSAFGGNVALGSGGVITLGSGGATTTELTYETANSVVRPPSSPTYTQSPTGPITVNWMAPAFGVVQTYSIYRSVNGGTPVVIGSVSGVNGTPPATTFTDTNPVAGTLVYTISTTLLPVPIDPTQRQSVPSVPAVLTINQTVSLSPLPSSVKMPGPQTVTATALSNGVANGLQVSFTATGSCSIGNQSMTNRVSSASVALNSTGSCTIVASQAGTNGYNSADPVSGTFTILPQASTTQSQTITFPQLQQVTYGNTFSLSATSSSGLAVGFTATGLCTTSGKTTGVGLCTITASAPANNTYSAASVSQSFTIIPAVVKVTATTLTSAYGQPLPTLTYTLSPLVNGDLSSAVSGIPALSTTATATSNAGSYPITVSTGSLAAANYSFLYVGGTLTIQQASQSITFTTSPPATAAYGSTFTVAATSSASGNAVTFTNSGNGVCSNSGATYTMTNSTGTCSVIASQAGSTNYLAAPPLTKTVTATGSSVSVSPSNINFGTVYAGSITTESITVTNTGTTAVTVTDPILSIVKGGNSNEFVAVNLCLKPLAAGKSCTITIAFLAAPTYSERTATLEIMDNVPGSPQPVTLSAAVINPIASFSVTSLSFGTIKHATSSTLDVTLSNTGATPLNFSGAGISVTGANATDFVQTNNCGSSLAAGAKCTIAVKFTPPATGTFSASLTVVDNARTGTQTIPLSGTGD